MLMHSCNSAAWARLATTTRTEDSSRVQHRNRMIHKEYRIHGRCIEYPTEASFMVTTAT